MKMKMAPPPMSTTSSLSSSHQQFQVTEDTPVDYLEGCMEILVVFPNEKSILMSIQRRMPMLDLLIHVTAANKLSPAAHSLQVTDEESRHLPHKPSTPIGSLNAHKVYIVAKNRLAADRSSRKAAQFEPTFRLQVRLPRNQLFVTRVTGRTQLADLLHTVCNEKDLDPRHYELRHPVNSDERLRLNNCLDDYKLQEVVLVPTTSADDDDEAMNSKKASPAMPSKTKLREGKKRGLLGLLGFGKHKKGSSMGDSSISSDSAGDRSISPSRSDEPPVESQPVAPTPPSPVLVSKRLAEEAVAKRNSRLLMNQKSAEAASAIISSSPNGLPKANRSISNKKRQAPPPPQQSGTTTPVKAASEVSSYSTSSSATVSPPASVINNTDVARSPSPKLSQSIKNISVSSSNRSSSSSNLVITPHASSSNLTLVPSSSNASLSSAVKKRKAPVPPALIKEQVEVVQQPAVNGHDESNDKMSTVSDQASSTLSEKPPTSYPVVAPKPAARSRFSPPTYDEAVMPSRKSSSSSSDGASRRPEVPKRTAESKRKQWKTEIKLEVSSDDDDDEKPKRSRNSSVSEFFSLSEDEEEPERAHSTRDKQDDPDAAFAAMCAALARRKQLGNHLPSDLSMVPFETLQEEVRRDDVFWRRSSSEPELDSPRSSTSSSSAARKPSSESDYEVVDYKNDESYHKAEMKEEVVISEPIYTMVIKSPRPMRAVDLEPEVERVADESDSPVMWEYKLPDPPTPFQDSTTLDKLPTESSRRSSSMSLDSLQQNSFDEDDRELESPRDVKEATITFGDELLGESVTEFDLPPPPVDFEVTEVVLLDGHGGDESTTDEQVSLPPLPATLPPSDDDSSSSSEDDLQFSIATYKQRVELKRADSPDGMQTTVKTEVSATVETKEPEVPKAEVQLLPVINMDFIQQIQNALHTIADPLARAELLRLQQQLQVALQQTTVVTAVPAMAESAEPETLPVPPPVEPEVIPVPPLVEPKVIPEPASVEPETLPEPRPVEPETLPEPVKERVILRSDSESSSSSSEPPSLLSPTLESPETDPEAPVYRYTGPPQVKMETWKPGRPRSEIIDYSRSSSFNVPFTPKEKQQAKEAPQASTHMDASPAVIPEEVPQVVEVALQEVKEEPKEVETPVRDKIEQIEGTHKPIVLRKSSFLTAKPFEARPNSMPIKRPNFTPTIQPVPFVSRKIRAPEVRGFASLPPVDFSEPPPVASKPRIAPVSRENPTVAIRNKLIESARRPSAELNGIPIKPEDEIAFTEELLKKSPVEARRPMPSARPLSMPMSSSLLLAAVKSVEEDRPLSPQIAEAAPQNRRSLSSKFVRRVDPREELLNSIRDFANAGGLKKTGARID